MKNYALAPEFRGFTLIEMLVALAIGAGIAVMSYNALDGAIKADEKVSTVTQQVDEVDRVWQYLGSDLLYAVPRLWRNPAGDQRSALIGVFGDRLSQSDVLIADETDYVLQFIRGSRENLRDQARSNLYLVGYRLTQDEGGDTKTLWRDAWSPVDGYGEPRMQRRQLLSGIKSLAFRYLPDDAKSSEDNAWVTGWPTIATGVSNQLPIAVEVVVDTSTMGEITRLFLLTPAS
jgi:general secretion pathway protein J